MRSTTLKRGHVSLERALSKLGLASRTQARAMILAGEVMVNGRVERNPGRKVVPETYKIVIGGAQVAAQSPLTLLLNKPRGVVTTRSDEKGRPTVYSVIGEVTKHLIPVGRLDLATSGLLLMTNDTQFSAWVTEPANAVTRTYAVSVRGEVTDETAVRLCEGIQDAGDLLKAKQLTIRKRSGKESHLIVELDEGKNREIRRLLLSAGHEVTRLKRISFGGLELGELAPGQWRELSHDELQAAFPGAPLRRGLGK